METIKEKIQAYIKEKYGWAEAAEISDHIAGKVKEAYDRIGEGSETLFYRIVDQRLYMFTGKCCLTDFYRDMKNLIEKYEEEKSDLMNFCLGEAVYTLNDCESFYDIAELEHFAQKLYDRSEEWIDHERMRQIMSESPKQNVHFYSPEAMRAELESGSELYDLTRGVYIYGEYNEHHAIVEYHKTLEDVKSLVKETSSYNVDSIFELLGPGGSIIEGEDLDCYYESNYKNMFIEVTYPKQESA